MQIVIAKDFSKTPGPRSISEGNYSGELFRKTILANLMRLAISRNEKLLVDLDGADGYGTSFLEEAFGGLIRIDRIPYSDIIRTLEIKTDEEDYLKAEILKYLEDANAERP